PRSGVSSIGFRLHVGAHEVHPTCMAGPREDASDTGEQPAALDPTRPGAEVGCCGTCLDARRAPRNTSATTMLPRPDRPRHRCGADAFGTAPLPLRCSAHPAGSNIDVALMSPARGRSPGTAWQAAQARAARTAAPAIPGQYKPGTPGRAARRSRG